MEALKAKLSPKCNLGFFCECIGVKPLCKSIITTKEALLRPYFRFWVKLISNASARGTFTLAIFKTLKRLNST